MAWKVKDEWIDIAQGKHTVVFHNPEVQVADGAGGSMAAEHHLINHIGLDACPHCGVISPKDLVAPEEFKKIKAATLDQLNAAHHLRRQYAEKHGVRIGSGPKK